MKKLIQTFINILKDKNLKVDKTKTLSLYDKLIKGQIKDQSTMFQEMAKVLASSVNGVSGIDVLKSALVNKIKFTQDSEKLKENIKNTFTQSEINKIKDEASLKKMLEKKYTNLYAKRQQRIKEMNVDLNKATDSFYGIFDNVNLSTPENFKNKSLEKQFELLEDVKNEYQKVNTKRKRSDYIEKEAEYYDIDTKTNEGRRETLASLLQDDGWLQKVEEELSQYYSFDRKKTAKTLMGSKTAKNYYNYKETIKAVDEVNKKKRIKKQYINSAVKNGGWKKFTTQTTKKVVKKINKKKKAKKMAKSKKINK